MPQIHERHILSDFDHEIIVAAVRKGTDPAFIERPGFLRCPRCKRCWPDRHFKPNHAAFSPSQVQARCRDCRRGVARALRQEAARTGICGARGCDEPLVEKFQCAPHRRLSVEAYAKRAAKGAAK